MSSAVRAPRLRVTYQGRVVMPAIECAITSNSWFQADTFECTLSINADPEFSLAFWSDVTPPLVVIIEASLDAGCSWDRLIRGQVDVIDPHLESGSVQISGRDAVTAVLIDTLDATSRPNKTSSQIVQEIASEHGFKADVAETSGLVGKYDGSDHNILSSVTGNRTIRQFDLLCALARREGYDVWGTPDNTLHFKPPPNGIAFAIDWKAIGPTANVENLTLIRDFSVTAASVTVRSYDSVTGRSVSAHAGAGQAAVANGKARQFDVVRPNLTLDAAQREATRIAHDLAMHSLGINFDLPGDVSLQPRQVVSLTGTNSVFDGRFRVDRVDRRLSFAGGYTMHATAKTDLSI